MSQKTDLNVSPYFDDFSADKNFYRVLFKPGFPVQSRELTTLQSILQNQIESFGSHFFKDGSVVIPGDITYNPNYYAVKLNTTHLGIDIGQYITKLIGVKIKGQTSQLTAVVQNILLKQNSSEDVYTLYVKYITSDLNYKISQFIDGETLVTQDTFSYGNTPINSGETIATLVSSNATDIGSAVSISKGVYFVRGTFVTVQDDTLILDQYSNTPSYRIGLSIQESIEFASSDNPDLFDNARGFANYSAPGADRLKISAKLSKKPLTDFDDKNFVEILRVTQGTIKKIQDSNTYSLIKEYIAKRTYDESGDYALEPFNVDVVNSLNDRINSDGIYYNGQKTEQNNTPSDNLLSIKISPGKAYVKGFDVEKSETTVLDVEKPRSSSTINSSSVPFEMGNLLKVNNVSGSPLVGIDNNQTLDLHVQRKGSTTTGTGTTIGKARVYSFSSADAPYSNSGSQWNLYLYDVQTYTLLTINQSLATNQCPATSFVKGLSSGASGYVVNDANSDTLTLSQTSGTFISGEQISINGTTEHSRSVVSFKNYGTQDVKSVFQNAGLSTNFVADTLLQRKIASNFNGTDVVTITSAGIVTCAGRNFLGIRSDAIIRYQRSGFTTETYNRVVNVSADGLTMTVVGVNTVAGVCDGAVPSSTVNTTFSLGVPSIQNDENAFLYAKINHKNISDVNLSSSQLLVNRQATGKSTNASGTLTLSLSDVGISSAYFETFDVERYSVFYNDGTVDQLTSDKFTLDGSQTTITLSGLSTSRSNVVVNATLKKNSIKNKQKLYNRSQKLEVTNVSSGIGTVLSGLTTSQFYGLRIEDQEISLNVPDVVKVIAVYESLNSSTPTLDNLTFGSGLNLNVNAILGEKIIGATSGAVAQVVTRSSSTVVEFVYLNSNSFIKDETVTFEESNIVAPIVSVNRGNYINQTQNYTLDKGQKEQYYDYSRIVRKINAKVPARRLLVIFDSYTVPTNDSGDVYTVKSYDSARYSSDIPVLGIGTEVKASDILDFRPRVAPFTSTTSSPFSFSSRNFSTVGINPTLVVAPNESSTIGYSYYLPRVDKIVLNKNGTFSIIKGIAAENPKEPTSIEDSMDIATIELPAYLYSPKDSKVNLVNNKRYTMRDIGKLEKRIENVEEISSLSLLELNTKTLQIQDSDGLSRFKSGFFADNLKNNNFIDIENPDAKCSVNTELQELNANTSFYSIKSELGVAGSVNISTADFSTNLSLLDLNIKKTGDIVSLNYTETLWNNVSQTFATTDQKVNTFGVSNYNGFVKLRPSSDTWVRTVNSGNGVITRTQGDWKDTFISNVLESTTPFDKFKEKNVEFYASGLQPSTQYYPFLDANSNIDFIPKLLKIAMITGTFQAGEIVDGFVVGKKLASFRIAKGNHKSGTYTDPSSTYPENPYNATTSLAADYTSSSTVLNIDTYSLSDDSAGRFFGYTPSGMVLIGKTSGAQATVSTQTLISDSVGDLIGCFYIRNPLQNPAPSVTFNVGTKTFKLSSSSTNSSSTSISFTQTSFYPTGIVKSSTYTQSVGLRRTSPALPLNAQRRDPLSQTFRTDNVGGFVTSVDLYFSSKDSTEKLFVELRETDIGGVPTSNVIQDFARTEILPAGITTSSTGDTATNIKFLSPVYLEPNKQYALSLICPSSENYKVWIAESNQATVATQNLPNAEQVIYSNNYTGGNLFKPQNGSIWNSALSQDLKFRFYKANFTSTSGTVYFHNPNVSVGSTYYVDDVNVPSLVQNPIKTYPRKLTVGIQTSSSLGNIMTPGRKVGEGSAIGYVEKVGGFISGITTSNVGVGYSNGTFTAVPLYTITGSGSGATANITFASNKVSTVSIASSGTGYAVGDVLGITTSSVIKGTGAKITVSSNSSIDTLYLTNVQGEEFTTGQNLIVYNGTTSVSLAGTTIRGSNFVPSDLYTGNVFEVTQYNHGMHSDNNTVVITGVAPDTIPELLTASVSSNNTTISVASTAVFTTFEGSAVSASNPGYVLINNEIIAYTAVGSQSLTISFRGVDGTPNRNHSINDSVYKYEVNGISLRRINRSHTLPTNATLKSLRDIDRYHLQFDRSDKLSGDSQISFIDERIVGGSDCKASKNFQFSSIIPQFNVLKPDSTTVSAQIRTVSGTSVSGSEASFIDQGYEPVTLNDVNNFATPRMICSRINENTRLSGFTNNKSLTLGVTLSTTDTNLSPIIDVSEAATFIMGRNRINKPILNYVTDSRSNQLTSDPHAAIYISNRINLLQPATSLKVIMSAYRHSTNDFRVLYRLFKSDSSEINQSYQLFPGYNNLVDANGDGIKESIIDVSLNDGSSDVFVRPSNSNEFLEYQFTANDLGEFNGFAIKIVMNGTNEAFAPRFKDIRAIALA